MIYAQIDVDFPHHSRAISAGISGRDLYVAGLCYAKKYLTDGHIPAAEVRHLSPGNPWRASAAKLVAVGLWEKTETGYLIHDYGQRNPPAAVERARMEQARSRKKDWWDRHRGKVNARRRADASSTTSSDGPLDAPQTRHSRARVASPSAVPPYSPPSSGNGGAAWSGRPSQDPARLRPCTIEPPWRNPHEYHVHGAECRFR